MESQVLASASDAAQVHVGHSPTGAESRPKPPLTGWTRATRCFSIRAACSAGDLDAASGLIAKMYATRGYEVSALPAQVSSSGRTFVARDAEGAVGTMTIGLDGDSNLLADELFPEEVQGIRALGHGICEFTKLAMDRRARSPRLLASLFHVAYAYAYRIKKLRYLLIEVNPRHVSYYEAMLGFKVIGASRHNTRVNAPAVLLALDLRDAEMQIDAYGGQPHIASKERSAYPYFFSAIEEVGMVAKMTADSADIVLVGEFDAALASHVSNDGVRH